MKAIIKTALFLSCMLPVCSYAGDGSGKINQFLIQDGGVIMFDVANHNNPPTCSSHAWAFDANAPHGKAMYAMLLAAATQGKEVVVQGAGDCAAWGDRERPYYIVVNY